MTRLPSTPSIRIVEAQTAYEREPLTKPFGFKGHFITELWQSVAQIRSTSGELGLGLGTQSVLWSDASVLAATGELTGNALMFSITQHALCLAQSMEFRNPAELMKALLPEMLDYARRTTGRENLRETFVLNALVPLDLAAWMLWARETKRSTAADLFNTVPPGVLSAQHQLLTCIPLLPYGADIGEACRLVAAGACLLKIKIGSDPDQDGSLDKMLEWDQQRLASIHEAVRHFSTPHTMEGHILYYLDANGRYDSPDRVRRLLDFATRIGAFDRIVLLEEPFTEKAEWSVADLGVRVAADESIHSPKDIRKRLQMGYGAFALKPIAKTLSLTLAMAAEARAAGAPCFCADLTVNPILVEWNKLLAARLPCLPGLNIGAVEVNGFQNYLHWDTLCRHHPCAGQSWTHLQDGCFILDDDFRNCAGGVLHPSAHYQALINNNLRG